VKGFTLIELVITVAIVAVLASVALPLNELVVQRAKEQDLRRALRDIREAIDAYKQAFDENHIVKSAGDSGYPKRLEDLVAGVEDQQSPKKARIYFLRRVPRDPFSSDPNLGPAESWGSAATSARRTSRAKARTCSTCSRSPRRPASTAGPIGNGDAGNGDAPPRLHADRAAGGPVDRRHAADARAAALFL